jgi:hypothetical protein
MNADKTDQRMIRFHSTFGFKNNVATDEHG